MFKSIKQKYQILQPMQKENSNGDNKDDNDNDNDNNNDDNNNEDIFNYDNYKWIYIHTISRCFGSYMNCTYFVPFC